MADRRISEFLDGGLVQTGDEIAAVRGGDNYKVSFGSAAALDSGQAVGDLVVLEDDGGGNPALPAVSGANLTDIPSQPDPTVAVSADDDQSGFLEDKLVGSATITVTKETDTAGYETLRLDAVGGGGVVGIADGGTGADNVEDARDNLGLSYEDVIATTTIIGLDSSNNPVTPNSEIDTEAGACWSSDQTTLMVLASPVTIDITDSADGNSGGSIGNDDDVYRFIVADSSGTNPTTVKWSDTLSPTFTGYDKMRLVGARRTNGSGNLPVMYEEGDEAYFEKEPLVFDVSTLPTALTSHNVPAPDGVALVLQISAGMRTSGQTFVSLHTSEAVAPTPASATENDMRTTANGINSSTCKNLLTTSRSFRTSRSGDDVAAFRANLTIWNMLFRQEFL